MEMETENTTVEDLFYKTKDYVNTRIDLFKLKAINKSSSVFSITVATLFLIGVLLTVLLFLSFLDDAIGRDLKKGPSIDPVFLMRLRNVVQYLQSTHGVIHTSEKNVKLMKNGSKLLKDTVFGARRLITTTSTFSLSSTPNK